MARSKKIGDISLHDIVFLESLGDTDVGFVARGEVAEMYGVPVKQVDDLILRRIYGRNYGK